MCYTRLKGIYTSVKNRPSSTIKTTILYSKQALLYTQPFLSGSSAVTASIGVTVHIHTVPFRLSQCCLPRFLVKHTRTDRIRTGTDCRIKTFRSTVLLLQGTHPLPLLMQFVAGVYPFPLTVLVCFVLLGGIEPPTSCVSDRCSKTN